MKGVISDEANNDGRNGVQGMAGYTGGHVERGRFGGENCIYPEVWSIKSGRIGTDGFHPYRTTAKGSRCQLWVFLGHLTL